MNLTQNRISIAQAIREGKIKAICGYPGIGKTFLTKLDERFEDGWLSEHLYIDKQNGVRHPDFPRNYKLTCIDIIGRGKIIVTAMSEEARAVFHELDIPYLMIYPNANEKERYFEIYDTRPDVREWISLNKRVWDEKIEKIHNSIVPDNCYKDEIPYGVNLFDYMCGIGALETADITVANS